MARTEATNTFNKGLIMDLNPINTPNEVLTDCVNGTIITYDGNEYTLQNDKGNFELKNCKLKENYIPVGLKEYGDILYIVSYNPLNKHVEIGSYPSPKTLSETGRDATPEGGLDDIVPKSIINNMGSDVEYEDVIQKYETLQVFYGSTNPDDYKLNPGDEYYVEVNEWPSNEYETLEFYIVDDDRETYLLGSYYPIPELNPPFLEKEPLIEINRATGDLKPVKWEVPGWMAVKPRLVYLDDLQINTKKIWFSNYSQKGDLTLNFQVQASDLILVDKQSIKVHVEVNVGGVKLETQEDYSLSDSINLFNGVYNHYKDSNKIDLINLEDNTEIIVTAFPYITVDGGKKLKFTNLQKSIRFNTSQTVSADEITIGENTWRYVLNNDQLVLTFDSGGLAANSILNTDIYLFCTIKNLKGNIVTDNKGTTWESKQVESWNLIGETIWKLNLCEFTGNLDDKLYPEDIYIFSFDFYDGIDVSKATKLNENSINKLVVASKLMERFYNEGYACLDDITFDQWIGEYENCVKNKNLKISNLNIGELLPENKPFLSEEYSIWEEESEVKGYSRFKTEREYSTYLKKDILVGWDGKFESNINLTSNIYVPYGPLWYNLDANLNVTINNKTESISIDKNLGKFTLDKDLNINGIVQLRDKYVSIPTTTNPINIFSIDERDGLKFIPNNIGGGVKFIEGKAVGTKKQVHVQSSYGGTVNTISGGNTYYTLNASKRFIEAFEYFNTDIALVQIRCLTENGGPNTAAEVSWMWVNVGDENIVKAEGENAVALDIYGIVFPITEGGQDILGFIKISDVPTLNTRGNDDTRNIPFYNDFVKWTNSVHYKKYGTDIQTGYFCELEKQTNLDPEIIFSTNIKWNIQFGNLNYNNKDLFKEDQRNDLIVNYNNINANNFNLGKTFTLNKLNTISGEETSFHVNTSDIDTTALRNNLDDFERSDIYTKSEQSRQEYSEYESLGLDDSLCGKVEMTYIDSNKQDNGVLDAIANKKFSSSAVPIKYVNYYRNSPPFKSTIREYIDYYLGKTDWNLTVL